MVCLDSIIVVSGRNMMMLGSSVLSAVCVCDSPKPKFAHVEDPDTAVG